MRQEPEVPPPTTPACRTKAVVTTIIRAGFIVLNTIVCGFSIILVALAFGVRLFVLAFRGHLADASFRANVLFGLPFLLASVVSAVNLFVLFSTDLRRPLVRAAFYTFNALFLAFFFLTVLG